MVVASDTRSLARLIPYGRQLAFARGDELVRQGEASEALFVILEGRVSVLRSRDDLAQPLVLAILGPGEVVGEMGLLDGDARSATVRAIEDTIAVRVDADAVARCAAAHPEISGALLGLLSSRLRLTDELVERLRAVREATLS